jgi:hypothetical protein
MKRRTFLQNLGAAYVSSAASAAEPEHESRNQRTKAYAPGRIPNEYSLLLPGEREALGSFPQVTRIAQRSATVHGETRSLRPGDVVNSWQLLTVTSMNGSDTAVFEKHVAHQGAIIFVTEAEGVILRIPKRIGKLENIRPRPTNAPQIQFKREVPYVAEPDRLAEYILQSNEDPCYENVAALGAEYIGYTLVANEQAGPLLSLFLEANGRSREISSHPEGQGLWAPDVAGRVFDPARFFPGEDPNIYRYLPGYSKRTLLGGYLPVADIGVWNAESRAGYEVMVLLPPGAEARPMGRVRISVPQWLADQLGAEPHVWRESDGELYLERYWNTTAEEFFSALAGIANQWQHFFEDHLKVEIPDPWLLEAARAGITLSRCSYRGLEPTYQIGEGAYTKIPERSHALFPVAHYEFVWAQQLWSLTAQVEPYFQHYLNHYILPDGNFLYNTQDQVEAPLNAGVFFWNSARAYDYTGDVESLQKRLPVLRRMLEFVLRRYEYSKAVFTASDSRYGLIWGSPEADLGEPRNDFPNSHPYYFQNATWIWRGLTEHARCLQKAGQEHGMTALQEEGQRYAGIAGEMRKLIEKSLQTTVQAGSEAMRAAGITPFTPDDIHRDPKDLSSYENHRFMMDWFTADWGNAALDLGHLKHREIAGEQIIGLHTDGYVARTSNFMAHGTLAVKIRQEDYRPFLLTLYSLCCYAADSGNCYSPEDAYLPGSFPGDGNPYAWSSVVNSVLQPALGLRWLLCYEESDHDICHLQKAAPKHWFASGQRIRVEKCPTRFGHLSWTTTATGEREWQIEVSFPNEFHADLMIHVHPSDGRTLVSSSAGTVSGDRIILNRAALKSQRSLQLIART